MSMTLPEAFSLSDEFSHPTHHLCGLCGNHGIIDTVGKIRSPAGVECGIKVPCLCANGRAIKRAQSKPLTPHRTRKKPGLKTFWMSWNDYSWKEPNRLGPRIIAAWESGQAGDGSYATIVAWVAGAAVGEAMAAIDKDYPCEGEREWRFMRACTPTWELPGDRFPLSKQAQAKLKKLKGLK